MTAFSTAAGPRSRSSARSRSSPSRLFVVQERRSPEPMISLETLGPPADRGGQRLLAVRRHGDDRAYDLSAGLRSGRDGQAAATAGFALSAMVLGWPIGATLSPRLCRRFGVRTVLRAGSALVPIGALAFVSLRPIRLRSSPGSARRSSAWAWVCRAAPRSC